MKFSLIHFGHKFEHRPIALGYRHRPGNSHYTFHLFSQSSTF